MDAKIVMLLVLAGGLTVIILCSQKTVDVVGDDGEVIDRPIVDEFQTKVKHWKDTFLQSRQNLVLANKELIQEKYKQNPSRDFKSYVGIFESIEYWIKVLRDQRDDLLIDTARWKQNEYESVRQLAEEAEEIIQNTSKDLEIYMQILSGLQQEKADHKDNPGEAYTPAPPRKPDTPSDFDQFGGSMDTDHDVNWANDADISEGLKNEREREKQHSNKVDIKRLEGERDAALSLVKETKKALTVQGETHSKALAQKDEEYNLVEQHALDAALQRGDQTAVAVADMKKRAEAAGALIVAATRAEGEELLSLKSKQIGSLQAEHDRVVALREGEHNALVKKKDKELEGFKSMKQKSDERMDYLERKGEVLAGTVVRQQQEGAKLQKWGLERQARLEQGQAAYLQLAQRTKESERQLKEQQQSNDENIELQKKQAEDLAKSKSAAKKELEAVKTAHQQQVAILKAEAGSAIAAKNRAKDQKDKKRYRGSPTGSTPVIAAKKTRKRGDSVALDQPTLTGMFNAAQDSRQVGSLPSMAPQMPSTPPPTETVTLPDSPSFKKFKSRFPGVDFPTLGTPTKEGFAQFAQMPQEKAIAVRNTVKLPSELTEGVPNVFNPITEMDGTITVLDSPIIKLVLKTNVLTKDKRRAKKALEDFQRDFRYKKVETDDLTKVNEFSNNTAAKRFYSRYGSKKGIPLFDNPETRQMFLWFESLEKVFAAKANVKLLKKKPANWV